MNSENEQRMKAVEQWANYVIKNKDWSRQQRIFIDSQVTNARVIGLTREQVAYIKEGKRSKEYSAESSQRCEQRIDKKIQDLNFRRKVYDVKQQ